MDSVNEIWKDIPGYEGYYQVSDRGCVRSLDRSVSCRGDCKAVKRGKVCKPSVDRGGYYQVSLSRSNKPLSKNVHFLVALTFLGSRPDGYHINHIDGNKLNNCLSNLEYCTQAENNFHARLTGLNDCVGEKHGQAKLKDSDIPLIRQRLAKGDTQRSIANDYLVSEAAIYHINAGKTWAHIS